MADKYPWSSRKEGISPGSMKSISQTKLKAFSVGQMNVGKKLSRRAEEEQKKKNQEKETAKVFEEFVASFEDVGASQKAFVRGSTINPETKEERSDNKTGTLYRPSSKISESIQAKRAERERADREREARKERERERKPDRPDVAKKKKEQSKAKSNLEIFKEELKTLQAEREERHRLKRQMRGEPIEGPIEPIAPTPSPADVRVPIGMEDYAVGSHDFGDPSTTNIFLGSINPKMNEEMLCEEFGKYGPLASVKIMWPRTDEERARNRNCGFVAFMNRRDAERALKALNGRDIMNFEMKLGWGKAVPLPPHPVYIPPAMLELTMPPPPSGLPFNAQPKDKSSAPKRPPPGMFMDELDEETKKTLKDAVVKVVIPTERPLLQVIHRMIEFVVREGPMFEAMVMNRELNNPMYRFLFENHSPAHVYYRWKLFSVLQGESPNRWRTQEFRMFKSGSIWRPPPINPYLHGMPDELAPKGEEPRKGQLSNNQRDKLEDMLRGLNLERDKIGEAMVYCLDHAEAAEEIVDCIAESLSILQTPIPKKIGRLFLVSDILFNSSAKVVNASYFRKFFENKLPEMCQDLLDAHKNIQQRLKAEQFKQKVVACFRSWEEWTIYPSEFLVRLQNVFLGLQSVEEAMRKEDPPLQHEQLVTKPPPPPPVPIVEDDLDGAPLAYNDKLNSENDKLDGEPIDGQPIIGGGDFDGLPIKGADLDGLPLEENSDIDGAPIKDEKDDLDGIPIKEDRQKPGFKMAPSKWESVDTSLLEEQAMTTSKWELLEREEEDKREKERKEEEEEEIQAVKEEEDVSMVSSSSLPEPSSSMKSTEMTEERRAKLREIELKVMKFQDDVEAGRRSRKHGMTITEQVAKYRAKLLQKEKDKEMEKQKEKEKERSRDREKERIRDYERARERERDRLGRESDDSHEDSPVPKRRRRRSRSRSAGSPSGKRNRSDSSSPVSERRSRRSSVERSPLSAIREYSDSPAHRSHRSRSGSPKKSGRRSHRSRSRSPRRSRRSRSKSPHRSRSHKKKRKL